MKALISFKAAVLAVIAFAFTQAHAQQILSLSDLNHEEDKNIVVNRIDDDDRASSFVIWVQDSVREHYHAEHTEIVYVIEGRGMMKLGGEVTEIGPGDYIFIPEGTHHSVRVIGDDDMKVMSIQTPYFDGSDRIFVSQ